MERDHPIATTFVSEIQQLHLKGHWFDPFFRFRLSLQGQVPDWQLEPGDWNLELSSIVTFKEEGWFRFRFFQVQVKSSGSGSRLETGTWNLEPRLSTLEFLFFMALLAIVGDSKLLEMPCEKFHF